jgi:hypothetical protein
MGEPCTWTGQELAGDVIAAVKGPGSPPCLLVQSQDVWVRIPEKAFASFLVAHADRIFVCPHAGDFHADLERPLGAEASGARAILWELSRQGRLVDVALLERLVWDAAGWYPDGRSEGTGSPPPGPGDLLKSHARLIREAGSVIARLGIADRADRWGPLGLTLEVQARVAARQVSRTPLRFADGARERLARACASRRDRLLADLMTDPTWGRIIKSHRSEPKVDPKGYPEIRRNKLLECLEDAGGGLRDLHELPIRLPRTARGGGLRHSHHFWRELGPAHRMIGAWVELMDTCDLLPLLARADRDELHARYYTVDGIGLTDPRLETLRMVAGTDPLFRPHKGCRFLVVRLRDLPLRALGRILDRPPVRSALAADLRGGADPVSKVAAGLQAIERPTGSRAGELSRDDWLRVARELVGPGSAGYSHESLRRRLEAEGTRVTADQVGEFRRDLAQHVYPELGGYLHCPLLARIAARAGMTEADLDRQLRKSQGDKYDPVRIGQSLCRTVPAQSRDHTEVICGILAKKIPDLPAELRHLLLRLPEGPAPDGGDDDGFRLDPSPSARASVAKLPAGAIGAHDGQPFFEAVTAQDWVGPTGRVYGRAPLWDTFAKDHLRLAQAVRKALCYELVRHGDRFNLCGVFEDELLIEVGGTARHAREASATVQEVVRPVLEEFLGDIPSGLMIEDANRFPVATT